ncbi:MAG: signal peptidase I [Parcubacteria group bacterium Gr01-1014_72]|nr:MAG: signal peptidase I [Parcubacteria group bacterium Gr01-1014_72]
MEPTDTEKTAGAKREEEKDAPRKSPLWEFIRFAMIAALIIIPFRIFIAQPFIVSGASMVPTFHNGEYLIVDELSYRFQRPERGDIIIFRLPFDQKKFLIKRIVGLPNETIEVQSASITVRSETNPEGLRLEEPYLRAETNGNPQTIALGTDEYLVLGDNREQSADSRIWGGLPRELIIGRAFLRLFPPSKLDLFPGKHAFGEEGK